MSGDRFDLEGVAYYRQGRKCGRPGCKCAAGDLHGPYWYRRDVTSGKVAYVGRELPPDVASARKYHDLLLTAMVAKRHELAAQVDVLGRLIRNAPLSASDRATIEALGFGAALVSPVANLVTQVDPSCVTAVLDPETNTQEVRP